MKISLSRRVTAVVAALGLALVAVPAAAPAANADGQSCGLGRDLHGSLSGPLGDSTYQISDAGEVQRHRAVCTRTATGSRSRCRRPIGVRPWAWTRRRTYSARPRCRVSVRRTSGTESPQVGPAAPRWQRSAAWTRATHWRGTGYANQGWAVAEGVESRREPDQAASTAGGSRAPSRFMAWGDSLGVRSMTQALVQRNPGKIAGTKPRCGALSAGPEAAHGDGP